MADPVPVTPTTEAPASAQVPPIAAAPPPSSPPAAEPAPAPPPASTTSPPATSDAAPKVAKPAEPTPAVEPAASVPTLLEKFDKEKADKEAAKAPAATAGATGQAATTPAIATGATAKAEAAPAPAPTPQPTALPPVEYKYTLPETIKMDDAMKGEVHAAFDAFRANPSEGAQGLINLHEKTMQEFAKFMADEQQRVFKETRQQWSKQILQDPEIGGSGHQTAMGAIARMRDLFVAEKDRPAFEEFLRVTGAGDHPQFMKMLHQAARHFDEPTLPPPNPRPPAGNGPRPPARRLRDIYEHTRSTQEGRS